MEHQNPRYISLAKPVISKVGFKPVLKYVHMWSVSEIQPMISWFSSNLTETWRRRENFEWRAANQSSTSLCEETVAFYSKEHCANNQASFPCCLVPVDKWNTCFLRAFLFGVFPPGRIVGFHCFVFFRSLGLCFSRKKPEQGPSSCMVSLPQCLENCFCGAAASGSWGSRGEENEMRF